MLRQYELVERVRAYDPDVDEALLNRAYVFTVQKHGSQKRASDKFILPQHRVQCRSCRQYCNAKFACA